MWRFAVAIVGACRFAALPASSGSDGTPAGDGPAARDTGGLDGLAVTPWPSDPHLLVCFSFDQVPLPAMLPNEGAVPLSAQLVNVTSTPSDHGAAAQVTTGSQIFISPATTIANIFAIEIRVRFDLAPSVTRVGLADTNQTSG